MAKWFHVSVRSDHEWLAPSAPDDEPKPRELTPHDPGEDHGFGEPPGERISVSPSVGQCLLGYGSPGSGLSLSIYEIEIDMLTPAPAGVLDQVETEEHWIQNEDIVRAIKLIPAKRIGQVLYTREMRASLKRLSHDGLLAIADRHKDIWQCSPSDPWELRD